MCCHKDILEVIPNDDIPKLRKLYENDFPRTLYIYNYLSSTVFWKKRYPTEEYVTLMSPYGKWQNGTFIAVHRCFHNMLFRNCFQFHCFEIYIFTLEKDCGILYDMIVNTKKLKWNRKCLIYAMLIDHYPTIQRALNQTNIASQEIPCSIWWMPIENALRLKSQIPSNMYVAKLTEQDVSVINSHWPHSYPGSDKYLKFIIRMNGGYGLYLKSTNTLIAWIMRIQIGMGTLHVMDEYKRKGYGSLITKVLTKQLAEEGVYPVASTLNNNDISQAMFIKLGFKKCASVMYLECEKVETLAVKYN